MNVRKKTNERGKLTDGDDRRSGVADGEAEVVAMLLHWSVTVKSTRICELQVC